MFALKRDQRKRMGEPQFVDRTVAYFQRHYPEFVGHWLPERLEQRVVYGIARARSHGLSWESSITAFVAHMITIHPKFDEQADIAMVLADPDVAPNERVEALLALPDRAWDEAEALPRAGAWPPLDAQGGT